MQWSLPVSSDISQAGKDRLCRSPNTGTLLKVLTLKAALCSKLGHDGLDDSILC